MAILTISRQFGSGSGLVLKEIVPSLNYALVDKRLILKDIRRSGENWETWTKELDETSPDLWEKYDRSFRGSGALVQSLLLDYALKDNVILKGRGANFLFQGIPHVFRTRFVASLDQRLERITLKHSVDEDTARALMKKTDRGRAGFVKALYGEDVNDPRNYDAVLDAGSKSIDELAAYIVQALKARSVLKTPEAQRALSRRVVAAKIKAKLITDPQLYVPVLDVECTETELVLQGIVRNPNQLRMIVEAARELAGEWPVKVELRYRL